MILSSSSHHARVCLRGLAARSLPLKASCAGRFCRRGYYHLPSSHDYRHRHESRRTSPPLIASRTHTATFSSAPYDYDISADNQVEIVKVADDGAKLILQFSSNDDDNNSDNNYNGDGESSNINSQSATSTYHASWLWSNDPHQVLPSGQRKSTPGQWRSKSRPMIREAKIIHCNISDTFIPTGKGINVPGPTLEDSSHPLPVYGDYPAWMAATTMPAADGSRTKNGKTSCRPYLQISWSTTPPITSNQGFPCSNAANVNAIDESSSIYDIEWLQRFRYDDESRLQKLKRTQVRPLHAIRNDGPPLWYSTPESKTDLGSLYPDEDMSKHYVSDGLMNVDYTSIIRDDGQALQEGLFRLLHSVFRDGAAIVSNMPFSHHHHHHHSEGSTTSNNDPSQLSQALETMPEDDLPVAKVAKAMSGGSLSHESLYGNTYHIRVCEQNCSNPAFTTSALPMPMQQDLAYYESPPGVKFIHCAMNGRAVSGGETTLIDAMAAAHRLRELRPKSFETLTQCPATFSKQGGGEYMTYRRPHIVLSEEGGWEINAVHWSPPQEGPVCLPPGQVERYHEAYADFERLLNGGEGDDELCRYAQDYTWERKLRPGEMLVFNNRRMFHGRRGFSVAEGASFEDRQRHLVACYTNIDDTLNSYRVLLRKKGAASTPILNVGNGTNIVP